MQHSYEEAKRQANDPESRERYWQQYADLVDWHSPAQQTLVKENEYIYKWFKDAQLNMSYNCIDRHAKLTPDQPALIYESPVTQSNRTVTYKEMLENVSKLAGVIHSLGLTKGDTCIIYMPMVPEAIFAMMACARVGVTHSVVFGGFSAKELASRIVDCEPKLIFSASCGIEPHRLVDYKQILDNAIAESGRELKTIILQRKQKLVELGPRDSDYEQLMSEVKHLQEPVPVPGDHPLYILYTSGTTGKPKGITRDTGGTAVGLTWTMKHIKNIGRGDMYFSSSDIGWVVGHSFIVYGPLLVGATTVLYEGKPNTPDAGIFWSLVEKYKVKGFYTAPTAVRFLRREDPEGEFVKKYDISSLKMISMAGERCDIPTFNWLQTNFPQTMINDNYWQTETGWMISCNYGDLTRFDTKPGSATKPCPGHELKIFDEDNKEVKQGDIGRICSRLPLPPSFMLGLWNNEPAFIEKYLKDTPGYYTTGDAGYLDTDGYLHVMTRLDDVINTAGHRLSTAQMEEVLLHHDDVVEAAVVACSDALKGEIPVGFVVLKRGREKKADLEKQLALLIREHIGPVATYQTSIIVEKLPKTKSGKVLRGTMKSIVNGKAYNKPATIEDESALEVIHSSAEKAGLGKQNIIYEEDL